LPAFTEVCLALFLLDRLFGVVEDVSLEALAGATEEAVEVEVDAVELHDRVIGIREGCAEVGGSSDDGDRLPIWTKCWRISLKMSDEGSIEIVAAPEFKRRICDRCLSSELV